MTQIQNFYETTITRNWTATTGDFNVSIAPTIPEGIIVISPSSRTLREIVRYTAVGTNAYGPFVTVSNVAHRGLGGTTAQSHTIGEKIRMNITAEHWTEMQDDINSIIAAGLPAGSLGDVMYNDGSNWISEDFDNISKIKLLKANSGTNTTTTATNLDTIAISGLTAKDTLWIIVNIEAETAACGTITAYNNTDGVILANLTASTGGVASGRISNAELKISQSEKSAMKISSAGISVSSGIAVASDSVYTAGVTYNAYATTTTSWQGDWTLALRSASVDATGIQHWSWKVYKISGQ